MIPCRDVAVVVRGLRRSFGAREVLRGIDLEIGRHEFVALLGPERLGQEHDPAGAGRARSRASSGELYVPARRSVVYQDPRLLPWARVLDNVVLGLDGLTRRCGVARALAEVGLRGHENDWPKTLSGGEAQRVALARALVRRAGPAAARRAVRSARRADPDPDARPRRSSSASATTPPSCS